jgi:DNA-binding protein H-NS
MTRLDQTFPNRAGLPISRRVAAIGWKLQFRYYWFLVIQRNSMATYLELKSKAEKMMAEAEQMRLRELNDVISGIKEKIKAHRLSAKDLGLSGGGKVGRPRKAKAVRVAKKASAIKYRGPNGETWGGGRGRKPGWVAKILASGKSLDQYAV